MSVRKSTGSDGDNAHFDAMARHLANPASAYVWVARLWEFDLDRLVSFMRARAAEVCAEAVAKYNEMLLVNRREQYLIVRDGDVVAATFVNACEVLGLDAQALGAALGLRRSDLARWCAGLTPPTGVAAERLARALAPTASVRLAVTADGEEVSAPAARWGPAFAPRGRFRLPDRIDGSGSPQSRVRDARLVTDLIAAYSLVIDAGAVDDIARWVNPQFVTDHWDAMAISPERREAWRLHLASLGYERSLLHRPGR